MNNIIIWFEFYSEDLSSNERISYILEYLPKPLRYNLIGDYRILSTGKRRNTPNKKTIVNYKFEFNSLSLKECNKSLIDFWKPFENDIQHLISNLNFGIRINYEVIVDESYPAFCFTPDFINFLDKIKVTVEFTFYSP